MKNLMLSKQMIDSYDLSEVIDRLVFIEKWKTEHAAEACKQYRNYLFLKLKYGNEYELPPSRDIDEAWHAHILHTEDYMKFCQQAFGEYLHHHPHTRNNTYDEKDLARMFEDETQKLHYQEFGKYIFNVRPFSLKKRIAGIIKKLFSIRAYYAESLK